MDDSVDPRIEALLDAGNAFARGVHQGEISRDAAAKALAGLIVAAGIPPAFVFREVRGTLEIFTTKN